MGRPILVFCLIFTTLCTGCASDQAALSQKVDEVNTRFARDTNNRFEEWYEAHPLAGFTLCAVGITVVAAAAVVAYVLICYRTHQPVF